MAAGYRVVVVDDGSTDETVEVRRLPVVYLRHAVNLGQGAALQTGMTYALRAGAEIAVHFDADGQHDCAQIERLIAPIVEGKADVVFGSRFLRSQDRAQVPWKKRILLRGGILISWAMTGMLLSDTHNGFRALSRRALERVQLAGERLRPRHGDHATRPRGGDAILGSAHHHHLFGILATEGPKAFGIAQYSVRPDHGETHQMILAQPILVALLAALVILYFARLRTRAWDILVILLCFGIAALLVVRPEVATRLAHMVGIGRGVDLILYLAIPGLALLILLLFARTRELNLKLTAIVRETALANAHVYSTTDQTRQ